MSGTPAASLHALLDGLIDYAGLYPPAALPLLRVVDNYIEYLDSAECWMLRRLVLPLNKIEDVRMKGNWRVTVLADEPLESVPLAVETVETKTTQQFPRPTYREMPLSSIADGWAKVRTGALTPDGVPSAETLADFLMDASRRRLPFKATAGLHHPLRSERALTYEEDSPRATMHGFINLFLAAAFAWHGADRGTVLAMLNEEDAQSLVFGEDSLEWKGRSLPTKEIKEARKDFAHSFGSCSFTEPVEELKRMGWL